MTRAFHVLLALAALLCAAAKADGVRVVRDADELRAAVTDASRGTTISLLAGDYALDRPLQVPDGVTLEGAGIMEMRDGHAAGFRSGPVSLLRAAAKFDGSLLTMGDGVTLRGLSILDQVPDRGAPLRSGNVVAVLSRAPRDTLSARIEDCEIVGEAAMGVTPAGPTGHGIVVLTRGPTLGQPGQPHRGAKLSLTVLRSVIRMRGLSLFIVNFASDARIDVNLSASLLTAIVATGGVSRPELVTGSSVVLHSRGNLYRPAPGDVPDFAWMVFGGSSPHLMSPDIPGARDNLLALYSTGDRIEGFRIGVLAAGARRRVEGSGPLQDNRAELELSNLTIVVPDEDAIGVSLHGTLSGTGIDVEPPFPAGERNLLLARMTSVRFDGVPGRNRYSATFGDTAEDPTAATNRLVIEGTSAGFAIANPGFEPPVGDYFERATDR